ncbi:TPA: hypothetical protein LA460_000093 [Clostridium botulinum]|nr:hypothetical protein [Clostridium botulinum]HBJ1652698.1 hypothetical protein [Clostridium botulinum]
MLTPELRTIDLKEVLELWDTDREKLKVKLLDDYEDLVEEFRNQNKIYNQESHKAELLSNDLTTFEKINYQLELGIDERMRGRIKFTNDLKENIKISLNVIESQMRFKKAFKASALCEIIQLKAREIEDVLKLLGVKVKYSKDFETDRWIRNDLYELNELLSREEMLSLEPKCLRLKECSKEIINDLSISIKQKQEELKTLYVKKSNGKNINKELDSVITDRANLYYIISEHKNLVNIMNYLLEE